jgi:hypothetical protein
MINLRGRSIDPFECENDRLRNLITGGGAAIVAMMLVVGIGTGIAGCINGSAQKQAIDPNDTVTFRGQIFGQFQPDDVNTFYGIAEKIRGGPLPIDPLCEGVGPRVTDRLRHHELVCNR